MLEEFSILQGARGCSSGQILSHALQEVSDSDPLTSI
jgi:hypothetical protein